MEDKILCNVSDLEPIADAVREKENTNKLYSVEELKVKVPELIGSGGGTNIGDSLDRLNTINGGTAATTIGAAVDNTEMYANNQEVLIAQIAEALEGKAAGGSAVETCTVTFTVNQRCYDSPYMGEPRIRAMYVKNQDGIPTLVDAMYQGQDQYWYPSFEIPSANTPIVLATDVIKGSAFFIDVSSIDPHMEFHSTVNEKNTTKFGYLFFAHAFIAEEDVNNVELWSLL